MAEPKYGALNTGENKTYWNKKAIQGITDVAEAQKNIGGIESSAQNLGNVYGGLQSALDQQQNAGIYQMRRMAGQQFANVAGRGAASNVMASGAADSAASAMSGQVGQFMTDIANQKAQAAIAGAQAQYGAEKDLYDYRQTAAAADVDAAELFEKSKLFDNLSEDWRTSMDQQIQGIMIQNWANAGTMLDELNALLTSLTNPLERQAALNIAKQVAKRRHRVLTITHDGVVKNILAED